MNIQVLGRNIEVTDALKQFAENKMQKLFKFHEDISKAVVTLDVEHVSQIAEGTVLLKGFEAHASAKTDDMYASIEALVDKLITQVSKHKEKLIDKSHHRT